MRHLLFALDFDDCLFSEDLKLCIHIKECLLISNISFVVVVDFT